MWFCLFLVQLTFLTLIPSSTPGGAGGLIAHTGGIPVYLPHVCRAPYHGKKHFFNPNKIIIAYVAFSFIPSLYAFSASWGYLLMVSFIWLHLVTWPVLCISFFFVLSKLLASLSPYLASLIHRAVLEHLILQERNWIIFFFYPPQTYPKNSWFILFIAGSLTLWQLNCVAFVFHGNASHIKIDGWLRARAPDMAFRNSLAGPLCLVMNFQTSWDRRFAIITFQWCVFILSGFKFMVLSYTLGCFGFTCFEGKCVYS